MKFKTYITENKYNKNIKEVLEKEYKDLSFKVENKDQSVYISWDFKNNKGTSLPDSGKIIETLSKNKITPKEYKIHSNYSLVEIIK